MKLCTGCGSTYERWHADYCPSDGWGPGVYRDVTKAYHLWFKVRWYFKHNFVLWTKDGMPVFPRCYLRHWWFRCPAVDGIHRCPAWCTCCGRGSMHYPERCVCKKRCFCLKRDMAQLG